LKQNSKKVTTKIDKSKVKLNNFDEGIVKIKLNSMRITNLQVNHKEKHRILLL
jgi:hypothetical protein